MFWIECRPSDSFEPDISKQPGLAWDTPTPEGTLSLGCSPKTIKKTGKPELKRRYSTSDCECCQQHYKTACGLIWKSQARTDMHGKSGRPALDVRD